MNHESLIAVPASALAVDGIVAPVPMATSLSLPEAPSPEVTGIEPLVSPSQAGLGLGGLSRFAAYSLLGHGLALALCIMTWTSPAEITSENSEISIEIVSDAAPPEVATQEASPDETKPEEITRDDSKPEEMPQPPQQVAAQEITLPAPPEPAPVVMPLPPRQPPVKKEAKQEPPKPKKKPEQNTRVARDSTGLNEHRAARVTTAPPSYLGQVSAMLHRAKVYPASARERGEQGRTVIRFTILRSGNTAGTMIVRSSGHRDLDLAASSVIARAGPFPPLPADYALPALSVTVPIEYSLR